MIRSLLSKIVSGFLIISIIYAGSFTMMEETSEKTERAEGEREAIQSNWDSSKSIRLLDEIVKDRIDVIHTPVKNTSSLFANHNFSNYNIIYIYYTSYLDISSLA